MTLLRQPHIKSLRLIDIRLGIRSHIFFIASYIIFYDMIIESLYIFFGYAEQLGNQPLQGLINMIIDLHIAILLLQPQQIEYVIPLALLLYDVDIVID
jgi:hypothetical protein